MPDFSWRAASASGQIQQGHLQAQSVTHAMKLLREQGLHPLNVSVANAAEMAQAQGAVENRAVLAARGSSKPGRKDRGPVNAQDVLSMTSELTIMLRAGLALDNALKVLIDMSHKPAMRQLTQNLLESVKSGATFSKALAQHPRHFDDFYINMVRSGEASGQMAEVLRRLVEHMERLRALRESVVSALIYPAILLSVAVLTLVLMLGFVVPKFRDLFEDLGDALPLPTQILMWVGDVFTQWGWLIALVLVFGGLAGGQWLRSPAGKLWWQGRVLQLPLLGPLVARFQMTLFARSWGTLLGNGVPMLTALSIATDTVGNAVMREPLKTVAPVVKDGGRVVQALQQTGLFEPLAINLIRVGEETGRVGQMALELADILNRQVETGIKRALTLIEPLMILVLGVLVALIIISLMMGVLSVNDLVA